MRALDAQQPIHAAGNGAPAVRGSAAGHWLVRTLGRANVPGAAGLQIPPSTPVTEAWRMAAEGCGLSDERLAQLVAARFRTQTADLGAIEPAVIRLMPGSVARQHLMLPVRADYHQLVIAVADPNNLEAEQAAAFASGRQVRLEVAPPALIQQRLDELYSAPNQKVGRLLDAAMQENTSIQVVEDDLGQELSRSEVDSEPVIRLTNLILVKAIEQGASDIHLQPERAAGVVRFRVDGVLRRHLEMPMPALVRVISRIKVMGKMDIADHLRPQDGRARVRVGGGNFDLRISTVPAREAEKAVIRILDQGRSIEGLPETGMDPREVERFRTMLKGRDGIVVVTGPTGSGKTTTLYSALRELSTEEVNIMTVEDPIEYELPGITQIQVDTKRKVTFANTLRAILRQDPDIILVGEIRDLETAEVAVQAAMTGHLVLATLHTNDAVSAVQRLLDIGLDRAAVAGSLRGSLAQRLVRKVCPQCKGAGGPCEPCGGTGYRSRLPVVELLAVDEEITRLILGGAPLIDLQNAAVERGGMRTMQTISAGLVTRGITTAAEVERVLGETVDAAPPVEAQPTETPTPPSAAAVAAPVAQASAPHPAPPPESTGEHPDCCGHVLVVDDDAMNRMLARKLLEKAGFSVEEAKDGLEALTFLQAHPDVSMLLLDLDMPELGGRDVLKAVRGSVATAGMPVIVLTGSADESLEFQLMDEGADDYIRKPIEPARLISRVKAALRRAAA